MTAEPRPSIDSSPPGSTSDATLECARRPPGAEPRPRRRHPPAPRLARQGSRAVTAGDGTPATRRRWSRLLLAVAAGRVVRLATGGRPVPQALAGADRGPSSSVMIAPAPPPSVAAVDPRLRHGVADRDHPGQAPSSPSSGPPRSRTDPNCGRLRTQCSTCPISPSCGSSARTGLALTSCSRMARAARAVWPGRRTGPACSTRTTASST